MIALLMPIAFAASADVTISSDALYGRVVATDAALPLDGVYISVRWSADFPSIGEGRDRCVKSTSVKAGSDGRFQIPAWSKTLRGEIADLWVDAEPYSPGFENALPRTTRIMATTQVFHRNFDIRSGELVLRIKPAVGTPEARADYLNGIISRTICEMPDTMGVEQLYAAMLPEAKALPQQTPRSPLEMTLSQRLELLLPKTGRASQPK